MPTQGVVPSNVTAFGRFAYLAAQELLCGFGSVGVLQNGHMGGGLV
jgi:hypothetical protein